MEYRHFAGQSRSVDALFSGIESGRVVHAVIIEGNTDSDRQALAKAYAHALLCRSGKSSPCNACKSCRLFTGGNHPDIVAVSALNSASIGVEDIAQLIRQAYIMPNEGGRKVFIIEDAHLLTVPAQNKLLKLLEEPPFYLVILLLCGNISSILPTVLSRCIRIRTPRMSISSPEKVREGVKPALHERAGDVFFGMNQPGGKLDACEFLIGNRQNARHVLNIWQNIFRDCLAVTQGSYDIIGSAGDMDRLGRYARAHDAHDIIRKLDMLCQAEERLLSNCQYAILIDWLMSVI